LYSSPSLFRSGFTYEREHVIFVFLSLAYLLILAHTSWATESYSQSHYLCLDCQEFPLCFSVAVLGLTWIFWSILNLFLYRARDRGLVSVFYMWINNFPNTFYWKDYLQYMFLASLLNIRWL
jgi:hypothetical protein